MNMLKLISSMFSIKRKKHYATRNGRWREYSKQGVLITEGDYYNGVKTGKWKLYYDTGELAIEETFKEGKREGIFKSFYKEGQLISEGEYRDNKREGKFNIFTSSGVLMKSLIFHSDKLVDEKMFIREPEAALLA